jgi:hypothetical protein
VVVYDGVSWQFAHVAVTFVPSVKAMTSVPLSMLDVEPQPG